MEGVGVKAPLTRPTGVASIVSISEEGNKSKGKTQKSVRDYDKTVILKESTIDKYLKDYAASNPKYAQAYITYMGQGTVLCTSICWFRSNRSAPYLMSL